MDFTYFIGIIPCVVYAYPPQDEKFSSKKKKVDSCEH